MESATTKKTQSFLDFVKSRLTALQFENLHTNLEVSKTKLTQIFNNPRSATIDDVEAFAKVLGLWGIDLVNDFSLGRNFVTLQEADALEARKNMEG